MSYSSLATGKCIIVSAPSGAGKTTLVQHLMSVFSELSFSVSACSRNPRPGEVDGLDYYFMSVDAFKQKITNEAFVEWEEVYPDHFYGTLKSEITRLWEKRNVIIFDVDVVGGLNLKAQFPHCSLSLFIEPPSLSILEGRLRSRQTESEDRINTRIKKASWELEQAPKFDKTLINHDLIEAKKEAVSLITAFLAT
ncbi:MAG: guanylate kinase [Flavobacteriales bacterium]